MLGRHSPAKGGKIAPVRSSSALVLSSTNANRERIYVQQPPIAASGYSSQAMNPHYPHTERKTETRVCSDCHLSAEGDNNAILAQTLMLGTKFIDFVGFNAWVGGEGRGARRGVFGGSRGGRKEDGALRRLAVAPHLHHAEAGLQHLEHGHLHAPRAGGRPLPELGDFRGQEARGRRAVVGHVPPAEQRPRERLRPGPRPGDASSMARPWRAAPRPARRG
jgi:hypothetical protein